MFAYYMSDACIFLIRKYSGEPFVNIGTCDDISIADFAALVAEVVGFTGRFVYDTSKPDGTPRKLVDVGRLNALGWRSKIPLRERSEEHTSELQSLMRISYAVFCLKKKTIAHTSRYHEPEMKGKAHSQSTTN